jgi:hypothetical protein
MTALTIFIRLQFGNAGARGLEFDSLLFGSDFATQSAPRKT